MQYTFTAIHTRRSIYLFQYIPIAMHQHMEHTTNLLSCVQHISARHIFLAVRALD
jgi:hypothetical protein